MINFFASISALSQTFRSAPTHHNLQCCLTQLTPKDTKGNLWFSFAVLTSYSDNSIQFQGGWKSKQHYPKSTFVDWTVPEFPLFLLITMCPVLSNFFCTLSGFSCSRCFHQLLRHIFMNICQKYCHGKDIATYFAQVESLTPFQKIGQNKGHRKNIESTAE